MKANRLFLACFLIFNCFHISVAQASQLESVEWGKYLATPNAIWRLKTDRANWQLSSFNLSPTQVVSYANQILVVANTEEDGQQLFSSPNGLSFTQAKALGLASSIRLKTTKQLALAAVTRPNGSLNTFVSNDGLTWGIPAFNWVSEDELNYVYELDNDLLWLKGSASQLTIYGLNNMQWLPWQSLACENFHILKSTPLLISCQDKYIWQVLSPSKRRLVFDQPVGAADGNQVLIAGQDLADPTIIYLDNPSSQLTISIPDLPPIQHIYVIGSRVIWQLPSGESYELLWQQAKPEVIKLSEAGLTLVKGNLLNTALLTGTNNYLITGDPGNTVKLNIDHTVTNYWQGDQAIIVWQTDLLTQKGGLAYCCSLIDGSCQKVNPWSSTTSPIHFLHTEGSNYSVGVVTDSGRGNFNLYSSTNLVNWQRINLPSKPTLNLPISQVRLLPANSLVELNGVITTLPGLISKDVIYLQDETAGIQIYLSSTKGQLPKALYKQATAYGELSSSQTKRVVLGKLGDLELGHANAFQAAEASPTELEDSLGQKVILRGFVSELSSSDFELGNFLDLKIHFTEVGNWLQKLDQVGIEAIVDWNSQTNRIEAWGSESNLTVQRSQETAVQAATASSAPRQAPTKSSAIKAPSNKAVVFASVAKSTAKPTSQLVKQNPPVKQDKNQPDKPSPLQTTILTINSLLVGLLLQKGRLWPN